MCVAGDGGVQEARLIADADRRGVKPRGLSKVLEKGAEVVDGKREVRFAIAEIAAERDGGERRGYSTQRVPITSPV